MGLPTTTQVILNSEIADPVASPGSLRVGTRGARIGRDKRRCNLVIDLPYVSREHIRLVFHDDRFFVEDLGSTDGTMLNGQALDANRQYSLIEDDRLTIGDVSMEIKEVPWYERLTQEGAAPPGADLADHREPELAEHRPANTGQSSSSSREQARATPEHNDETVSKPALAGDSAHQGPDENALVIAFLEGLQLTGLQLPEGPAAAQQFMGMAGHLLHISVEGIRRALYTHDKFRDQYRIPGTLLSRSQMNPLYSHQIDTTHVLEVLFSKSSSAIVDPVKAIEEATSDFYAHGIAVPTAVDEAIQRVFKTFDWRELEAQFESSMPSVMVGPLRAARLWQCFCKEYDRRVQTLDEFDNEYRNAVGHAYAEARHNVRLQQAKTGEK